MKSASVVIASVVIVVVGGVAVQFTSAAFQSPDHPIQKKMMSSGLSEKAERHLKAVDKPILYGAAAGMSVERAQKDVKQQEKEVADWERTARDTDRWFSRKNHENVEGQLQLEREKLDDAKTALQNAEKAEAAKAAAEKAAAEKAVADQAAAEKAAADFRAVAAAVAAKAAADAAAAKQRDMDHMFEHSHPRPSDMRDTTREHIDSVRGIA